MRKNTKLLNWYSRKYLFSTKWSNKEIINRKGVICRNKTHTGKKAKCRDNPTLQKPLNMKKQSNTKGYWSRFLKIILVAKQSRDTIRK